MLFLFIISSIFTLTVASKSEVTPSGSLPAHVEYVYANTYKGGQLTAGNTATLTLTGLRDVQIHSLTLTMHSNQSSGAGSLVVTCGERTLWEIENAPFSDGAWCGLYSSADVDITHRFPSPVVAGNDPLKIEIAASVNSLYISSYTIEYTAAQPRAYTVSFSVPTGAAPMPLTESAVGSGVVLPNVDYEEDGWRFLGWTMAPIGITSNCPQFLMAGEVYHPLYDATLYALYSNRSATPSVLPSRPQNGGVYMIVLPTQKYVVSGCLNGDYWPYVSMPEILFEQEETMMLCTDRVDEKQMFSFMIEQDSLVYLSCYGDATPIGYSNGKLKEQKSVWILRERAQGDYDLIATERESYKRLYIGAKMISGVQYPAMILADLDETKSGLLFYDMSIYLEVSEYRSAPPGYEQGGEHTNVVMKARKVLRDGMLRIIVGEREYDGQGRLSR